ncbi:MAG: hypothetical protein M1838_002894 [Thelocarpon superellum]|nr:MAG: hypothetical protein M1838_002894 [Thelocarpon superellum]
MEDTPEKPPVGVQLTSADSPEKEPEGAFKDYLRVFKYADTLGWTLNAVALLGSIASGAALPLMTVIFGQFSTKFNNFSTGRSSPDQFRSDVDHLVLYFVYLFVARFIITYVSTVSITISAIRTTRALRRAFLESTLRQEAGHFDKQSNGAAATQVTTNGNRVNQGIAEKLAFVFQALSTFFSAFIVALAVQWKLALITMSLIPVIFIATGAVLGVDSTIEAGIVRIYSRAAVLAQESIASISTIQAFSAQKKMVDRYDDYLDQVHQRSRKKSPLYGILFSTEYFCVYSAVALSFWQGFRMYQSGEITDVGTVFTVILSAIIAATSISAFAPQIQTLTNAASAASELFSIIDKSSQLDPLDSAGARPSSCHGQIEVCSLNFAYPTRPLAQVLHDLTLTLPAGKTTALVGASGCGKSTVVGLLERWYEPTSGQILLDGNDISTYNTKWLRSTIRLVQQEPVLFRGTVFQNVAKGFLDNQKALSTQEQRDLVQSSCKASNAHEFICQLPSGYDTELGEGAGMLSGGQRQRLAIARAIISDPTILLLDEATSALDPRAENLVQDALRRVSENRTTLVIAHKLATVRDADKIVVMSAGQAVEEGTHHDLVAKDGRYAALVRSQDLGHGDDSGDVAEKTLAEEVAIPPALEQVVSTAPSATVDVEARNLTRETLGYSLLRCIIIMFSEQTSLYLCFVVSTIACLIGGATYPAQALLFSRLLTVFTNTGAAARQDANFYSLMFFVVALGNLLAYFVIGWNCNIIGLTVTHRYRLEMFQTVLKQDMDFFDRAENSSGALASKLSVLPTQLQELISINVLLILIVLVNVVSSSVLALAFGWKLGLVVVFGGLPPLLLSGYVRIRLEQRLEEEISNQFFESAGLATEAVAAIKTVSSLCLESAFLAEYSELLGGIVGKSINTTLFTMLWFALAQSLEFLLMALGFWYGGRLIASGEYTTQQFYVIFIGVLFSGQAAGQFFSYSTSITKAIGAANYILWLRTLIPKIRETEENRGTGPSGDGAIALDDVAFRYEQRRAARVLGGISLKIEPGQFVAIVGASGCGKSTLISLLERFYEPISGRITLDGRDVSEMSPRLYRQRISLVKQEPILYQGSVRENISLGLEHEASEEQIIEACRQANALEFVQSLPEGFDTPCGSRGLQFSGGQRQRIAIARAMIRNPRLVLLDEATSALDTQSEQLVQAALDAAAATRTTISVAHRLSTIRNADVIYVFDQGKIAETGSHEELQRQRGIYHRMCVAQSLDQL